MWETVVQPLIHLTQVLGDSWKKILATLLLLIGGWIISKILKVLIVRGLKVLKLDLVAKKAGIEGFLKKGGVKLTAVEILGALVYWIALIIVLVMILGLWHIDVGLSQTLVPFLPKIFAAIVILILGLFIASLIEDLVRATAANADIKYAFVLGKAIKWILVVFVVLTAVQQLEIQTEFISLGFLIILGSLGLGLALALGLGAKDIVAGKLAHWVQDMEKASAEAKAEADKKKAE